RAQRARSRESSRRQHKPDVQRQVARRARRRRARSDFRAAHRHRRVRNHQSTQVKLTTPLLTCVAVAATLFGADALELRRGGAMWRVVTCHFTHFSYEQLAWDAVAFLLLGLACERRHRAAFHATLLASIVFVPIAVLVFTPEVVAYRGLSGI